MLVYVFVYVWVVICPPRLRPLKNSEYFSHAEVKSRWWTKMGTVTNHNVMQLSVLIVAIPPPDPTSKNSFSREPTSGASEITDLLRPGRGNTLLLS